MSRLRKGRKASKGLQDLLGKTAPPERKDPPEAIQDRKDRRVRRVLWGLKVRRVQRSRDLPDP